MTYSYICYHTSEFLVHMRVLLFFVKKYMWDTHSTNVRTCVTKFISKKKHAFDLHKGSECLQCAKVRFFVLLNTVFLMFLHIYN